VVFVRRVTYNGFEIGSIITSLIGSTIIISRVYMDYSSAHVYVLIWQARGENNRDHVPEQYGGEDTDDPARCGSDVTVSLQK
jgi:hypothetical protein